MTLTKEFNMADVLGAYYGRNIEPGGVEAIKEIGKTVTGHDVNPFDASCFRDIKRAIETQFPQIKQTSDIALAILDDECAPLPRAKAQEIVQKWVEQQIKNTGRRTVKLKFSPGQTLH